MKKYLLYLGIGLSLLACSKGLEVEPVTDLELDFTIDDASEPDTRGVKKGWANNDKIYVFFDKELVSPAQYLVIQYKSYTKQWIAYSWSDGLKEKIAKRTSGTLSLLYVPNDKVGGTIEVRKGLKDLTDPVYWIAPKEKGGDTFSGYALVAQNRTYSVTNGVVKCGATMKPLSEGTWVQFCIKKDRDGKSFTSDQASRYKLVCEKSYDTTNSWHYADNIKPIIITGIGSDGEFMYSDSYPRTGAYISAYMYSGLCFAGTLEHIEKEYSYTFYLLDNNGTPDDSSDDCHYYTFYPERDKMETENHYIHYEKMPGVLPGKSLVLPALDALDDDGEPVWIKEDYAYSCLYSSDPVDATLGGSTEFGIGFGKPFQNEYQLY